MAFVFKEELSKNLGQAGLNAVQRFVAKLDSPESLGHKIIDTNPFKKDPIGDKFVYSNTTYSGTDCTVFVQVNEQLISLGNIETFTYSIFREKAPVRVLGRSHPRGFTAGPRTIAGTMIFAVFDRSPMYDLITTLNYTRNPSDRYTTPLPDELPPLDYILIFNNEYGHTSIMKIYGVEVASEGQTHSINDLYSENTMQYLARDIDVMISMDRIRDFKNMLFERMSRGLFIDNHLQAMLDYKRRLEREIYDIDVSITSIDQERGRRSVAGVMTLGISAGLTSLFSKLPDSNVVTRRDLDSAKKNQLDKKSMLLKELLSVNEQIYQYENNIKGWNAQNAKEGVAAYDYLSHRSAGS